MLINFISNIPQDEFSGGFSAVNLAVWEALREISDVRYVGPIRPPVAPVTKYASKLLRMAGFASSFPAYSEHRLRRIADEVQASLAGNADMDVFTGLTPWVRCPSSRRRIAWTDCTFRDYMRVYHRGSSFHTQDIERVAKAESAFSRSCERVLITSEWALANAADDWECRPGVLCNIGIFGNENGCIGRERFSDSHLLFSSTNFQAKGGHVVLKVFAHLRRQHPDLKLIIIGDAPRSICSIHAGVQCLGYLCKSDPVEHEKYRDALARAFCLVLPTSSDMAPLTPLEAAAFGTPTIAFGAFAIPELIIDGKTGILLEPTSSAAVIANAVSRLMNDPGRYEKMRAEARRVFVERFSKEAFQRRILRQIQDLVECPDRRSC